MQIAVQQAYVTPVDRLQVRRHEDSAVGIPGIVTSHQGFDAYPNKQLGFGVDQDANGVMRGKYQVQVGLQYAQVPVDHNGESQWNSVPVVTRREEEK